MFPDMLLHNVLPITKDAPLVPIHGMPHWGLILRCHSVDSDFYLHDFLGRCRPRACL
jgi:hypothetical protein